MSLLADALQPHIVRELASIAGRTELITLADVIIAPRAGYDLQFDAVDQSILIDFRDTRLITNALAADCCRFSLASFQTMSSATTEFLERDNVGWGLVKLYYAAFYAGHALIRLFGEGCSYFDRRHVGMLSEISVALDRNPPFRIDSGLYRCLLSEDATSLKCCRARGTVGGAHESFWGIFGNKIQLMAESVLSGSLLRSDAQAVFAQLEDFGQILRRKPGHSWLSVVRNDLQYRHEYGVWFPAQIRARDREDLASMALSWNNDPMQIDLQSRRGGALGEFVMSCAFVVALCREMLRRIADRSTVGARSFVRVGPMAYLNDKRARAAAAD